ncbi:DUF3080 family protein [Oceanospirillum sediminis]|uniref:DUF3080 family protein n=1 Tax=Oceanospirillum sediminis TaxID=2760088 RepID=A0A839IP71_9GAMM|nr:DUF3080 family protein [Oceanospirillum sediminis]MBB1486056.1 DUF3080 family protein [Oceanospirillum sediminis]
MLASEKNSKLIVTLITRSGLLLVTSVVLAACSKGDSLQYRFDDYQARLANILDIPEPENQPLDSIRYPEKRMRLQSIPEFEQGLVEVWDFSRCELMELINKRNSNLGKVMPASQRFIYENKFWQKLSPCYEKREQWRLEDNDFVQRLEQLHQHKQQIMPLVFQQMLFSGPELENQFANTQPVLTPGQTPEYLSLTTAMDHLLKISDNPLTADVDGAMLEQNLQSLYQQPLLQSVLKTLQLSTSELNQTSAMLEQKFNQRPLCLTGRPTPRAKKLFNVLQKFYLQAIQPELAHHNRIASQLLPRINQLFLFSTSNQAMETFRKNWLDQEQKGLWQAYLTANQKHTSIWNQILRSCGLFPRQN